MHENFDESSIDLHERHHGKLEIKLKVPLRNMRDLSLAYTPGVAAPCREIHRDPARARDLTIKRNTVAIVSDGSAVLGLGNIGALAAIPVMEGKAALFKEFAGVDGFPICLDTQNVDEIVETVRRIAPVFGGINLEDIGAPRCFEVEERLQDLGIPVFHDDQHGTAIVLLAALINACKVTGKTLEDLTVVISGSGAAGVAVAKLLLGVGYEEAGSPKVKNVILVDSKGALSSKRTDLPQVKRELLEFTNNLDQAGSLQDVLEGADVFVGVSQGNLLKSHDVRRMAKDPLVFAMANPIPEISPKEAYEGGAALVGTGRSDYPNQVNNVLAFPGIFRGALDAGAATITPEMKVAAALALAEYVAAPTRDAILPSPLDHAVGPHVAKAVAKAAIERAYVSV